LPSDDDAVQAAGALPSLQSYLARHPRTSEIVHLIVEDDDQLGDEGRQEIAVPGAALKLLARVLAHMAAGQGVAIVPSTAELTTQQAADLLNVSRPYLIRLLEEGRIDFRKVGTHRRVLMDSLVAYKRADDLRRRKAADELAAMDQELGLT
jgi:excisionase family DNA binding protein